MAIVAMADAVPDEPALSAEYNKLIDNIEDLDSRVTTAQNEVNTAETNISALDTRLDTAESDISTLETTVSGHTTSINARIQESVVNAKGDILVATADNTVTRLGVGSNDQVLTADSAQATGLKWATPSGGGGGSTEGLAGRIAAGAGFIVTGIAGTEKNIPDLAITGIGVTVDTFYGFALNLSHNYSTGGASSSFAVRVRQDTALTGTILAQWNIRPADAQTFDDTGSFTQLWKAPATDATTSFHVSVVRLVGTAVMQIYGDGWSTFFVDVKGVEGANWVVN